RGPHRFPYTTLFRSQEPDLGGDGEDDGSGIIRQREGEPGATASTGGDQQQRNGGGDESVHGTATLPAGSRFPPQARNEKAGRSRPAFDAYGPEAQSSVWRAAFWAISSTTSWLARVVTSPSWRFSE